MNKKTIKDARNFSLFLIKTLLTVFIAISMVVFINYILASLKLLNILLVDVLANGMSSEFKLILVFAVLYICVNTMTTIIDWTEKIWKNERSN